MSTQEKAAQPQTREQFEEFVVKHLGDDRFLIRDDRQPDKYDAYLVDHLWAAWQAGAAKVEAVNKELLERCEKMRWFLYSEAHEWTHEDDEKLDAAIAKARGRQL